jgi:hypothetical protein
MDEIIRTLRVFVFAKLFPRKYPVKIILIDPYNFKLLPLYAIKHFLPWIIIEGRAKDGIQVVDMGVKLTFDQTIVINKLIEKAYKKHLKDNKT